MVADVLFRHRWAGTDDSQEDVHAARFQQIPDTK